jgi:hypothetical protein
MISHGNTTGKSLLRKALLAKENRDSQRESFANFQASFPAEEVADWEVTLNEWYLDPADKPCPFFNPVKRMFLIYS